MQSKKTVRNNFPKSSTTQFWDKLGENIAKGAVKGTVEILKNKETNTPEALLAKALFIYLEQETLGTTTLAESLGDELANNLIKALKNKQTLQVRNKR